MSHHLECIFKKLKIYIFKKIYKFNKMAALDEPGAKKLKHMDSSSQQILKKSHEFENSFYNPDFCLGVTLRKILNDTPYDPMFWNMFEDDHSFDYKFFESDSSIDTLLQKYEFEKKLYYFDKESNFKEFQVGTSLFDFPEDMPCNFMVVYNKNFYELEKDKLIEFTNEVIFNLVDIKTINLHVTMPSIEIIKIYDLIDNIFYKKQDKKFKQIEKKLADSLHVYKRNKELHGPNFYSQFRES